MPFSNNHQETLKTKSLLFTEPENYTVHLGPHREVVGRERVSAQAWGSAFIGVEGGPMVFQVHSLLVNLKPKGGNLKHG